MENAGKKLHILFAAAEAEPYIKIGGLGDVAGSLPLAITRHAQEDVDLRLVLPLHPVIIQKYPHLTFLGEYPLMHTPAHETIGVFQDLSAAIPVYFLEGRPVRDHPEVYAGDAAANGDKYIFFSVALLALPAFLHWRLDILHANDWHTAAAVYAVKMVPPYQEKEVKTVYSIHNLPFMGEGSQPALCAYGIPPTLEPDLPEWSHFLPLPLALTAADRIIPVSPGYAQEILRPEFGCGLEDYLRLHRDKITGILNGLDTVQWNPSQDPLITAPYSPATLELKIQNKLHLQEEMNFRPDAQAPLLTMVTRMDRQKGVDVAVNGLKSLEDQSWQAVFLGNGDALLLEQCHALQRTFPDRVRVITGYDNPLSHRLYAAADIFLMPSNYEPCGISQMIAMRYGTIPVAHATGGLQDTIVDSRPGYAGTGYLYTPNERASFSRRVMDALVDFSNLAYWQALQKNAMQTDFSWDRSAEKYIEIYRQLEKQ